MYRRILLPLTLATAGVVSQPALADEPYAVTPSGRTEAVFDLSVVDTSDRIANGCADLGWTVVNTTSTMVVCEAQMGTLQSVLTALTLGNQYSTPPRQFIRFNIAGLGRSSRVQATGWVETQMAFGQTRTAEMTAAHYHNNVMTLFQSLDGRFPPGTIFPNHAYIGSRFDVIDGSRGLRITEVEPGSPAARGGLQTGDVLTRLARERINGPNNLLDGLRKAAKNPTYEVEITRAGKALKLTLEREYRSAVIGPDISDLPPEPQSEVVQAVIQLSPADELAKFAKLRDEGIITAEEFDAQKAKLLGAN